MNKISYIHDIRGLAALFIVMIHCNIFHVGNNGFNFIWGHFLNEWTAVFVLISGFLFQLLIDRYRFNKFIYSKFKNVIVPYLIISIPAIAIYIFEIKKDHVWLDLNSLMSHSYIYIISFFYATGSHLGPLWFIPVICLIFLTSKPLVALQKNKKLFLITSLISLVLILATKRPVHSSNPLISYIHFLPVYIIGMLICQYKDLLIMQKHKIKYLSVFLFLFSLEIIFNLNPSFSILSKIVLFLFLCSFFSHMEERGYKFKILSFLADISFALYFLHGYFVGGLRIVLSRHNNMIIEDNSLLSISMSIASTVVIITLISIIYLIIKKTTPNSRLIIGS
ncbi:acyltransferase [Escherichia coli]|uniref:acyltransferase n=1 Tax=Escherichia coli TaxID=562 RepID=UPI00287BA24F|nr:acyltransferase [Escherichia coli]MDT3795918.1 acyltransferase [Escherichia coli]